MSWWLRPLAIHLARRLDHSQFFFHLVARWRCHSLPHWSPWRTPGSRLALLWMVDLQVWHIWRRCLGSGTWKEECLPGVASRSHHDLHHHYKTNNQVSYRSHNRNEDALTQHSCSCTLQQWLGRSRSTCGLCFDLASHWGHQRPHQQSWRDIGRYQRIFHHLCWSSQYDPPQHSTSGRKQSHQRRWPRMGCL